MADKRKSSVQDLSGAETEEKGEIDSLVVDKYNIEAAEILSNEALHLPISEAVPIYEQLLMTFPTAAKYWKQYVEAHMAVNNDDATKQIFSRCLLNCLQISLWRCYIRFIRKVNEKKGVEGQEETRKAFEFMLNYVGADIASGPVWMEYITFLKSLPAMTAQEESQRMTSVRKSYQKAIVTPTHHVEQLWKDYENFENSVSRALINLQSGYHQLRISEEDDDEEDGTWIDHADFHMMDSKALEVGNPQRIESASSNKRIVFTYEQCLMYLYHYPDIWYDYATWHAKSGSIDSAIKVFQRALKALPDCEMLRYAYAELEESRGAIQPAKKIYESLFGNGVNGTALAHIQFIRFLRRTEGVEAARKYFIDARKSPNCTYHVYVAYAMMAFCLDKDPKVAHSVFEAGLKRFMHEPGYILEDSCRLAQSSSISDHLIYSREAEQVEQRRKEALSRTGEEGSSALEGSLHDVVSRYSFMDLWPCSSRDLDHLAREEWLAKNSNKKSDKSSLPNGANSIEKGSLGLTTNSQTTAASAKVVYPDTSRMVIYDPRQKPGTGLLPNATAPGLPAVSSSVVSTPGVALVSGGTTNTLDEILKVMPPALVAFIAHLPAVEGPSPDVDVVLSISLQSNIPTGQTGKSANSSQQFPAGPAPSTSDLSGSNKSRPNPSGSSFKSTRDRQAGKRKDLDRQEDDETATVQSVPLPRDVFRIRQIQRSRGVSTSQTGSASCGSAFSGDLSGSTG
ncbi:hypothetical protein HHK36_019561 [Tetracentron sinense]|uniref:Suppressor of forked domain-containing protein n=1 Tax=Tetracentron sinense TaxID=13715 RepID=A0A835DA55_TETSI|nr:hypothetical protein HHK36_019561 [Tetracentron sinense]